MTDLDATVRDIVEQMSRHEDRGRLPDYIPALAAGDLSRFGIAVALNDGTIVAGGDSEMRFSIQSISKVFTLTLSLGLFGDAIWRRVGKEPSGSAFNSIVQLEYENGIPRNPFINAGAIAVADALLASHEPRETIGEILHFIRMVANDEEIAIDPVIARSETATGFKNFALANYLAACGNLRKRARARAGRYFPSMRHYDELRAAGTRRALSQPWRRRPDHRPSDHFQRAGAPHQCVDADLRPV